MATVRSIAGSGLRDPNLAALVVYAASDVSARFARTSSAVLQWTDADVS